VKRNGQAHAHAPVPLPPALERRVPRWLPDRGEAECSLCLDLYRPRAEGEPGGVRPWDPMPLCARCASLMRCA